MSYFFFNSHESVFIYCTGNALVERPSLLAESSIAEPLPDHDAVSADLGASLVTYKLVEEGAKRRRTMLVDSLGFTYNINAKRPYATYWQCTVRPKSNPCKASVTERDGTFQVGKNSHNHASEVGAVTARTIVKKVKAKALEDKFKPASAIVNEVITENFVKKLKLIRRNITALTYDATKQNVSNSLCHAIFSLARFENSQLFKMRDSLTFSLFT